MTPALQRLFQQLEQQRASILALVRQHPLEKRLAHPEGKWNAHDIIAHLSAAERLSVNYLAKKINAIDEVADSGAWEEVKIRLLQISQRLPLRFRAPQKVKEITRSSADLSELEAEWTAVRQELRALLEQIDEQHVRRKIFRHVRIGMIDIRQALIFFREHSIHHLPQIKNRLNGR